MMINIMSNNECPNDNANNNINSAYKINIWMVSQIYEKIGYINLVMLIGKKQLKNS